MGYESGAWDQCGGSVAGYLHNQVAWEGPTKCVAGYQCVKQNDDYSQCVPLSLSLSSPSSYESGAWDQCGGSVAGYLHNQVAWEGPTKCVAGYQCVKQNDDY